MTAPDPRETEYEQVNQNFRALADIRFRLLALVPTAGGAATYLVSRLASQDSDQLMILAVSVIGFLATLGITFYDQRNSQLYNTLSTRAKQLEAELHLAYGQFTSRPGRTRRLLFVRVGHDPGLALVYAPVLGAWFYPAVVAGARLQGYGLQQARPYAALAAGIATAAFLEEFLRLDGVWKRLWQRWKLVGAPAVAILFRVEAKPGKQQELLDFLRRDRDESMEHEEGTLRFDVFHDPDNDHAFYVCEAYKNWAAFEEHKKHASYQKWDSDAFQSDVVLHHFDLKKDSPGIGL